MFCSPLQSVLALLLLHRDHWYCPLKVSGKVGTLSSVLIVSTLGGLLSFKSECSVSASLPSQPWIKPPSASRPMWRRVCRYLSRWIVVLHAYWFGTGQRYKYHLSFLELFGVLVKTQSTGVREGGAMVLPWGGCELSGLWWMTARVFGFYCERRGPLADICFHRGPRKTIRWVWGLSSIVLSCRGTQRAGWSRAEESERGTGSSSKKGPVGWKWWPCCLALVPSWRPSNTCFEFEY